MIGNRRQVIQAAGAVATILTSGGAGFAQSENSSARGMDLNVARDIASAAGDAEDLGIGPNLPGNRRNIDPNDVALALSESLVKALDRAKAGDGSAADLVNSLGFVLSEASRARREAIGIEESERRAPEFQALRSWYREKWNSFDVDPRYSSNVMAIANRITSEGFKSRYKKVEAVTGVPWYVIGSLHYREANLNFMGHLHNGDFLQIKTVHVPKRRPRVWPLIPWDPDKAWVESAKDALQDLGSVSDWSVERMLYVLEGYNGWGYRSRGQRFVSPYLWNYTRLYRGGGYPRDGVWDPNYRSKQAGLVAILKSLKKIDPTGVQLA